SSPARGADSRSRRRRRSASSVSVAAPRIPSATAWRSCWSSLRPSDGRQPVAVRGAVQASVEPEAVDLFRPLRAAVLGEALEGTPARLASQGSGTTGVGGELEHRLRERLGLAGGHEEARLTVAHEVLETADRR